MSDFDHARTYVERLKRRRSRKPEPSIADPATHPKTHVCLRVAAEYLELDERSVRARIDDGRLRAIVDGKVYRIAVVDLITYVREFHGEHARSA